MRTLLTIAIMIMVYGISFAATIEYTSDTAFIAAAGSLTTINFDTLPNSSITGNEYVAQGLTFLNRDGYTLYSRAGDSFWTSRHVTSSYPSTNVFTDAVSDNFDFILGTPMTRAGLWLVNVQDATVQFLASDNSVIYTKVVPYNASHPNAFVGIITDAAIKRIRIIEAVNDGDYVGFDNVMFGCPVPEPASLLLIVLGIALGFYKRNH